MRRNRESMNERSCRRHLVLLGIGHTNAHVVRMWGMQPIPDTDLTCISDNAIATYSGMLPAALAGQISAEEMQIDLVRLCASVDARLIVDQVQGIDHERQTVLFADRPSVSFDALSIGIGSVPTTDGLLESGETLIKIKPMQTFLCRLADSIAAAIRRKPAGTLQIVFVGGGVAGVEMILCMPTFLRQQTDRPIELTMVTRSDRIVPSLSNGTRRRIEREFSSRGIQFIPARQVARVTSSGVELDDQTSLAADLVIWATGASAPALLDRLDLPRDDRGFLATEATLRSTSGRPVFAVGDTGTIIREDLPKAGVYAVRQGPVLWDNLQRQLDGLPLREYQPQQSFLKLINLGNGEAVGERSGISFRGRWVMRWKHSIDSKFMDKYRPTPMASDGEPMQCRGCGCKLGAGALNAALFEDHERHQGRLPPSIELEDAAEIGGDQHGGRMVASTDFFTSPMLDAYLSGRVAALHAASDIVASGATVTEALTNVALPFGDVKTQRKTLSDFLTGARMEFEAMGGRIVGGHTIVGPRMEVGFTVIGKPLGQERMRKSKLRPGDCLLLTKPLGTGILMAAQMRALCAAENYQALLASMLTRQHDLAQLCVDHDVAAGTDVTGFGLVGHLIEMLESSGLSASLTLSNIPLLPGVEDAIRQGIESSLAPENRRAMSSIDADNLTDPRLAALFDPQTCGGLLLAVAAIRCDAFVHAVTERGLASPVLIGRVDSAASEGGKLLSIH